MRTVKLLLLMLLALNAFSLTAFSTTIILFVIVIIANTSIFKSNPYRNLIFAISILIFFSFIPAQLVRYQPLLQTLRISSDCFYFFLFFAILNIKPNIKESENVLIYLSIIASAIYILQYFLMQRGFTIFEMSESHIVNAENGNVVRFRLYGSGIFSLAYFYAVNKFITRQHAKYLALSILNFIPIILLGFRTYLGGIVLFTIFLLFKRLKGNLRKIPIYAFMAVFSVFALLQIPAVNDRVDMMFEKQFGENAVTEDVRLSSLYYYTNNYQNSYMEYLLGSGIAYPESNFGKQMSRTNDIGLWYQDLGLLGLMVVIGPFSVICMILLNLKTLRSIKNNNYYYIVIWFLYLICVSFTTMEYYRPGNIAIQAFAMYIAYASNIKKKSHEKNRNFNISSRS